MKKLKFFGHSCFSVEDNDTMIMFDPYLNDNPFKIAKPNEVKPNYIFVSHGHFDHLGDAIEIAKNNDATIVSTAEICHLAANEGCTANAMHIGGKINFPFGSVRITLAFHGSGVPGGHACGFVVNFKGTNIYFAGDTGIFGDMKLIGELEKIDYALLPIGNNFTMGPEDAALAAKMLNAEHVIPMHYNTWPLIAQDPNKFKELVEKSGKSKVIIVDPGQTVDI